MKMRLLVITLGIVLVALNVLDILTTKTALGMGCEESNGFAIALFATFGFTVGISVKVGGAAMVGCLTTYSYHLDSRPLRNILTTSLVCMVCLYIVVVCNNIINILR